MSRLLTAGAGARARAAGFCVKRPDSTCNRGRRRELGGGAAWAGRWSGLRWEVERQQTWWTRDSNGREPCVEGRQRATCHAHLGTCKPGEGQRQRNATCLWRLHAAGPTIYY